VRAPRRGEALAALGARLVEGDLEDERALGALVDGQDVVFHVAGAVAARNGAEFLQVNRDGAVRIARAAGRAGVGRFVLVSSLAATGPSRRGETVDERTPPHPVSAYGRSKLAAEQGVRDTGVPLTVVRPPAVYGPRDRAFLTAFRAAVAGVLPLPGDLQQPLSLVHARDLAQALIAAADSPRTLGRTYHAAHPEPVTQQQLAAAIGRAVGCHVRTLSLPGLVVRPALALAGAVMRLAGGTPLLDGDKANELLAPGWVCSSEALQRDAAWHAAIPLDEGLGETAASYRALGWL
jgi:nucleoside-diphosphate-sugar epimerase